MRALFYQPSCGISGDMHIAAMLELGVPLEHLTAELKRLPLAGEYSLDVAADDKMGINGTCVTVHAAVGQRAQKSQHEHGHTHDADHQHHRHHASIVKMIKASNYAAGIEQRALAIFAHIAKAEAKIHNVSVADVHFHEVGAVDSIIDIVAAAICLEYLNVDAIYCNPVEVGAGHVNCAHGRFPVPAPATQELLRGVPCTYGGVQGESTTPTGAAILRASVSQFSPPASFTPETIGYGIGHKDFELPNVLRVALGTATDTAIAAAGTGSAQHYKIEANIDDMAPEAFEPLLTSLFEAGAGDAWCTPIVMKKSRSATCLSVLASSERLDALTDLILNRSTTIGLRVLPFTKRALPREELSLETSFGAVRVKRVIQPDGRSRWKSEHDDILAHARAAGRDYLSTKAAIDFELEQAFRTD